MLNTREDTPPYLDKANPEAWKAAKSFTVTVSEQALRIGLAPAEAELIKLRASQLNRISILSESQIHPRNSNDTLRRV